MNTDPVPGPERANARCEFCNVRVPVKAKGKIRTTCGAEECIKKRRAAHNHRDRRAENRKYYEQNRKEASMKQERQAHR